jgi:hypothetical protein
MNANAAAASIHWFYGSQLPIPVSSKQVMATAGTKVTMPLPDNYATMIWQQTMIGAAGSIGMSNLNSRTDLVDPEEVAIARMSTEELLAEVRASAGLWADRDDVEEFILSGRKDDRIEKLYAPYTSDDPITSI